ncbi:MAG: asparagine synthase (glutamine-hydrolyzing) [Terriglobia bacterium]
MCGIAGYLLNSGSADRALVQAMCATIRHRGPDDEGTLADGPCGIGMRRLSIIDLASGHQPISNEDGSSWVVFNGEIYNYQDLRPELIARGHRFTTNSDTETLIHLHEEWGVEGIAQLRGMFAYAIWDSTEKRLTLVRDRFGKKPLYYAETPKGFYFGSELKCLRAAGVPMEMDPEAIRLYLQLGYIPDPWSAYKGIRKLRPAHWLTIQPGGSARTGRYWALPHPQETEPAGLSREDVCQQIRDVFDESVRLRMIADVPLGAFLSGGLDSTLVVASMARQSNQRVRTFSIGFRENGFNEMPYAAESAQFYGTDHHELTVEPDAIELVPKLIQAFDEPFADSSAIPSYLVSQMAAREVKVALSGDGGDELFGGYHSFFYVENFRRYEAWPAPLKKAAGALGHMLPYSAYGKNFLRTVSRPSAFERYIELAGSSAQYYLRTRLFRPEWQVPPTGEEWRRLFPEVLPDQSDCLSQALQFEATTKLSGDILVKMDRMSMANSLEVRCPLLDHKLAELAWTIPNSWKTRDGKGKLILIEAMKDRLPPGLLNRPKKGFAVPLAQWFRGPLRPMLHDLLRSRAFIGRGIVSESVVKVMLDEHQQNRRDNSPVLWSLLVLERWFADQDALATSQTCSQPPVLV